MSLREILVDELRDLYSAENQQVKAGAKALRKISDETLRQTLRDHLEQTKEQVLRLRQVFEHVGKKATGKHCDGMEGCLEELSEALEEDEEGALKDAVIFGAALRTEHYEIAGYTAAIAIAKALKESEIVQLLNESLKEEQTVAKAMLSSATAILKQAASQKDDEEQDDESESDPKERESARKSEEDEKQADPTVDGESRSSKKKKAKTRK